MHNNPEQLNFDLSCDYSEQEAIGKLSIKFTTV